MAAYRSRRTTTRVDYKALSEGPKINSGEKTKHISWSASTFFPINIVDEAIVNGVPQVLVHYIDWDKKYNEWQPLGDVLTITDQYIFTNPEGTSLFYLQLATAVKENLHIQRKTDSLVEIRLPMQKESFDLIKRCGRSKSQGWYFISKLSDLNELLGNNWHFRVVNKNKDFAFIVDGTVRYRLSERRPLVEFDADGNPTYKHRGFFLVFKFLRDRGNGLALVSFTI